MGDLIAHVSMKSAILYGAFMANNIKESAIMTSVIKMSGIKRVA